MLTENFWIQVLIFFGGIITVWLPLKYKEYQRRKNPKDRNEIIYNGYESLIERQDKELDRYQKQLKDTWESLARMQVELNATKELVRTQQDELLKAKELNKELVEELRLFKKGFNGKPELAGSEA